MILKKDMIKEVTKAALAKLSENSSGEPSQGVRVPDFLLNFYNRSFSFAERDEIRKYFFQNPKAANAMREMKAENAFKLLKTIGRGGVQ
jgi:hypothetical protein